jgi:hypothetical protein
MGFAARLSVPLLFLPSLPTVPLHPIFIISAQIQMRYANHATNIAELKSFATRAEIQTSCTSNNSEAAILQVACTGCLCAQYCEEVWESRLTICVAAQELAGPSCDAAKSARRRVRPWQTGRTDQRIGLAESIQRAVKTHVRDCFSTPTPQWLQRRCSLGTFSQHPVSSAPMWQPGRNCASGTRLLRPPTAVR